VINVILIRKQPYWRLTLENFNRLNEKFRNNVKSLIYTKRIFLIYSVLQWICWSVALFILLSNLKTFENNNEVIKSILIISISGGLIIISDMITKVPKENLVKSKKKIQNEMLFDICTCTKRCTCRNELNEYFNKIHIDLFTKTE